MKNKNTLNGMDRSEKSFFLIRKAINIYVNDNFDHCHHVNFTEKILKEDNTDGPLERERQKIIRETKDLFPQKYSRNLKRVCRYLNVAGNQFLQPAHL